MVLLKMLMEIAPPQDGRVVGDDDDDDFPLREGSSPGGIAPSEGKSAPAQVPPRDGGAPSRKSSLYFLGQNNLYTRRWAAEVGLGAHNPPGRAWAPWRAQGGCAHLVGPLWYLFAPIFFIYSIKILLEVSACLELCRIGNLM